MKNTASSIAAVASLVGAALFAVTTVAQAPQPPQGPGGPPPQGMGGMQHQPAPKPTNLKVLPKDLTGEQVHEIMHHWAGDLGVECNTCHAVDPNRKMPNGRPALNFADDSKPEKATARLMYTMMQGINTDYIAKLPKMEHDDHDDDAMVTCGTCHRGKQHPAAFVPPPEHHGPPPGVPGQQPPTPR